MKASVLIMSLFVAGCASAINMKNADKYYDAALSAEWAGKYEHSKNMYYRSFVNARSASASAAYISATLYGYGRMLGYTCDADGAVDALERSLDLERKASGPVSANISKRLSELGRLNIARAEYANAAEYFEEGAKMLGDLGILESDPLGFVHYLETYSLVLSKAGHENQAAAIAEEAQTIKSATSEGEAKFIPVYYGEVCENLKGL